MYCKSCGNLFENPNAEYCSRCGTKREKEESNYNEQGGFHMYQQPPIKYRSIVACIILSIVTCGIYGIFWFVSVTDDANALANDYRTSGAVAFLCTIITCGIYGWYWAYRQGEKIDYIKQSRGIPSSNSGILYLILQFIGGGLITRCLLQYEINKFANM